MLVTVERVLGKLFLKRASPLLHIHTSSDKNVAKFVTKQRNRRNTFYSSEDGCYTQQDPIGLAGGNPTIYGYVCDPNWWPDPFGLKINFEKFTDEELLEKIWELAYRDKRLYNNGGTHGVVHRIREQILGKMRPPSKGWYTHDEQIRAELDNLRKALNEARSRGMSDAVNNKYPNINKVSEMQPPKSTDAKVPKICQ